VNEAALLAEMRPWIRAEAAAMLDWELGRHAEDIAQEAWIHLWRSLPDYHGQAPFVPWCKTVIRNRLHYEIRSLRAQKRGGPGEDRNRGTGARPRKVAVTSTDLYAEVTAVWEGEAACADVDWAYHHAELAAALAALSPKLRAYVVARFFHGLRGTELDAALGQSNSTASLWNGPRRGREQLARALEHLAVV